MRMMGDKSILEWPTHNIENDGRTKKPERPPKVKLKNIVGFNEESDKIIGYLLEERDYLDVISIIGMPGLGKTTLAGKVFHDKTIQSKFPTRIWLYISQEFSVKNVFLAILKELMDLTVEKEKDLYKEMQESTDVLQMVQQIKIRLEKQKFLIVMDDVWKPGDWEEIQNALPMTTNHAGKVLITSRDEAVSNVVNRCRPPDKLHVLRPKLLSDEDSWLLLQYEVFGKPECPIELKVYGEQIVRNCHGLPLAIAVISGMLVENISTSSEMTAQKAWEKVAKSVSTHLYDFDPKKSMEKIIAWSYDALPYPLRACFLYLGMFPEDFEIPVWKLIRMWIAEGLIEQTKKNDLSLEEVAEIYLDDLIRRNLVKADKTRTSNGRVKTCRIHDMLREFCINVAADENFFHEIKRIHQGHKCRRICIHSNITPSITSLGHHVRSFVCFFKAQIFRREEITSAIPNSFKLLRVWEASPFYFSRIPKDMYQLLHLRYLTLSIRFRVIPAALSKLWNLETFIVHIYALAASALEIKADIWKLRQLRHLKTNGVMILPKSRKSGKGEGEKLQTLGRISAESFKEEFVNRARNLKELSIDGDVCSLLDGEAASFNNLAKLDSLEKLKLSHHIIYPIQKRQQSPSGRLPPANQFPPKLKSLTLSGTRLHWDRDINILCSLENLEVLKLERFAFCDSQWEAKDGVFRCLEVLHIHKSHLRFWTASAHHYPKLRRLQLRFCPVLEKVPISLADIPTFQVLELYDCSGEAEASAKEIEEAKKEKLGEQNVKDDVFNLYIHRRLVKFRCGEDV